MSSRKLCLNIGAGPKPKLSNGGETWVNLDIKALSGIDVVCDIRDGLPFEAEHFDFVLADNVLEHFASRDAIKLLNEIGRVLKVNCDAEIIVPDARSQGAFQDPTHLSFWVPRSVLYWNQEQSPYGGAFVGITANLVAQRIDQWGNREEEAFIRFVVRKKELRHG